METISENFLAWAEDPARTLEERYGILRLIEFAYARHYSGPDKRELNYEADRLMRSDRCYDAAYNPVIDPIALRNTAGVLHGITKLELDHFGDERAIRDFNRLIVKHNRLLNKYNRTI
ncbi:MAG: hypothetical protein H7Y36_11930 [Armatimonadetes bacterium]|nr:hypothetical protein [Akkermansiaceae bacterium]